MLVTVESFSEPWEAHLCRARLQAEGIRAVIAHEHHVSVDWPYATALGGVKVQVPADDIEAAAEVMRLCRAGTYRDELDAAVGAPDPPHCPRCTSTSFGPVRPPSWIAALLGSFLWLGVIFPVPKRLRCVECGATWRP